MRPDKAISLALHLAEKRLHHPDRIRHQAKLISHYGQLSLRAKDRLQAIIKGNASVFHLYCFTWEYRDCRRLGCTKCPHGPYLYARLGKVRTYIGR